MIQSHHLPTCDDVFEVLTQGPFPTGQHEVDFPVQRHLTVCHSCRELAEALRPATEMLAEGKPDAAEEESSLPAFLTVDSIQSDRCVADQPERPKTDILATITGPLIALALCLMLILAIDSNWRGEVSGQGGFVPPVNRFGSSHAVVVPNLPELAVGQAPCSLAAIDFTVSEAPTEAFTAAHCCSQCHHAGSHDDADSPVVTLKQPQMLALIGRCQHCHAQ
ncbi:hypothetical protein [Bremerella cremea]|uniref:hypothetical protein n=1 Tax=Bremerella cremea TaxID=1031537 RepID=UPI0031EEB6B1